ncbi:hypothetical protein [Saccharothrix yanglingensis]|uniref:hypothetical protein n=1 Tax=Saccharothrix yanglingensis TaxID=659496 RepID=UPI0027D31FEA|nr:hypothetical protein [Saccharothrix yanglingensis]
MTPWKDLNDRGVLLAADGDLPAARTVLEAALDVVAPAERPQALLNLAQVVDLLGERERAVELLTEALALDDGAMRASLVAARADVLPWLGRWDEAWWDVEQALMGADPADEAVLRTTRVALLVMVGRSAEAERDAVETAALAAHHAPHLLANLHANLAALAEEAGDTARAGTHRRLAEDRGDPLVGVLVARALWLLGQVRLPEALADLDEASARVGQGAAEAVVRAVRALVLAAGGWYAEADAEARHALDLAYADLPQLAAFVHKTLAEVASGTGDLASAAGHLDLARELCAATGDVEGEFVALVGAGRVAYLAADPDRADALYEEAALLADDPRRQAVCLHGRAAVAVSRGRPGDAVALLDRVLDLFGDDASPLEVVAVRQVRGAALEAVGEFAAAESCYAEAAEVCEAAGLWHVALGMAWWRADALVRRAAAATGEERRALGARALDLALPAALAAEAVRQRFPHGPLRERWAALASAPATRSAFLAIRAVEDVALAAEYLDHVAGAVSLDASDAVSPDASGAVAERGALVSLPVPPPVGDALPYAASGFSGGDDPAFASVGFALPPRVRVDPAVPSALDHWIDVAARRYGFPVRADRAVPSW